MALPKKWCAPRNMRVTIACAICCRAELAASAQAAKQAKKEAAASKKQAAAPAGMWPSYIILVVGEPCLCRTPRDHALRIPLPVACSCDLHTCMNLSGACSMCLCMSRYAFLLCISVVCG